MNLDGNYSTINQNVTVTSPSDGLTSRIILSIPYTKYETGITGGDVIYFDNSSGPVNGFYRKSKADSPETAEVFGIVESSDGDTGDINVVIAGSINLPDTNIFNTNNTSLNLGSNDVYFLSGQTAGALENYPPTQDGYIIKPIYLNAPHRSFTGLVRNYVGYKNPSEFIFNPEPVLFTFSEDMTKSLLYNEETQRFFINSVSYSADTFTQTEIYFFDKRDLETAASQNIDFLLNSDYDAKISDDGKHILLFGKPSKKIYYIYIENGTNIQLKATIDVDLVGNPDDLIWAVDNEVTCFTIGTKCLDRAPDQYDTQINSYQLSSKIEYWKRNVNNSINPFRWRRTFNQPAFGNLDSKPFSLTSGEGTYSEVYVDGGIHRLSDLSCKNKNFVLSCKTLIDDQISYKSKITPISYTRYNDEIFNLYYTDGITSFKAGDSNFNSTPLVNNDIYFTNFTETLDLPQNKKYCCSFGVDQYRILKKVNDYYHEDMSYKKKNFKYDAPALIPGNSIYTDTPYNLYTFTNTKGKTLANSIKELSQLTSSQQIYFSIAIIEPAASSEIITFPPYSRNALISKCSVTDNFSLFAFLYQYTSSDIPNQKQLIITKYPFNAFDNLNVFYHYSPSEKYQQILPDDGTGYGYITSFRSSVLGITGSPGYVDGLGLAGTPGATEKIPCKFSSDNQISEINIDSLSNFSLFTSNDRFFIATSNKIIIWTFSTSSYIIRSFDNLDKASFYSNNNGDFFKLNNKIFKYNISTQFFDEQNI